MEFSFDHSLTYTNKRDVPVAIVAHSLIANERILQEAIRLLGEWEPKLEIQDVRIRVSSLSQSSPLKETLVAVIVAIYQDDIKREMPELIQRITGHDIPGNVDALVSIILFAVVFYISLSLIERVLPWKSSDAMKKEYEQKRDELSIALQKDPEEIEATFSKYFTENRKRRLYPRVKEFFRPAKLEEGTEIESRDEVQIGRDAVSQFPSEAELLEEGKRDNYDINGIAIEIHQADLDYGNKGWQAVIPEVDEKRHKLYLPDDISPERLFGRKTVVGNVTILEEEKADGQIAVSAYYLNEILD